LVRDREVRFCQKHNYEKNHLHGSMMFI
jgi:hypothetical protein